MPVPPISLPVSGVSGVSGIQDVFATPSTTATTGTDGGFADILANSVDQLQATQSKADALGVQAVTGDLKDVHDYTIASTEAALTTQMVVSIRDKGVEAFNDIMRMPV